MKKLLYLAVILLACNSPKGDKAGTGDEQAVQSATGVPYTLDSSSLINWAASKPTQTHHGTFHLKEGSFLVSNGILTGGSFIIDISSIQLTDLSVADGKDKLEAHLKSPDFFEVKKYPIATFEITLVRPFVTDSSSSVDATHTISGNLTLKNSTKNITFPAKVTIDDKSLTAKADFNIDRTTWGMNYKGPGNPQDWFISKQVNLKLDLSATRK